MLTKIKTIIRSSFWHNFKDVRFLGALAFGVIAILTAWSGVKVIGKNYEVQQEIAQIDKKNQLYKIENKNLELSNQFFGTDTYLELTARQHFSKGLPGEKLIIVPNDEALANAPQISSTSGSNNNQENRPAYKKNLDAWKHFFFRRSDE